MESPRKFFIRKTEKKHRMRRRSTIDFFKNRGNLYALQSPVDIASTSNTYEILLFISCGPFHYLTTQNSYMKKVNHKRSANHHAQYLRNSISNMISVLLLVLIIYFAFS